jgi:SAM-dependent methyltransferase
MDEVLTLLEKPEFPRSNKYDAGWVLENQMGPNALWLMEWLCEAVPLETGMRVLDLGCGKAMTSIFLAREFGVRVWAVDLWISPDSNWRRVLDAGTAGLVCPLQAEAHALPFAQGFFDVAVSVDAYQYFGTDELYLDYLSRFVRPGGFLGIAVPGLMRPIGNRPPSHLTEPQANGKVFWDSTCRSAKTADFWLDLWERCPMVLGTSVQVMPEGWRHCRDFERALEVAGKSIHPSDAEALERDQGQFVGLLRVVARRTETVGECLYDPRLGIREGIDG